MSTDIVASPVICPICGKDPKGRPIKDAITFLSLIAKANWKLCNEDQKMADKGFIALVEAEQPKVKPGSLLPPGDAVRTGRVAHVKRELANELFGEIDPNLSMIFCEPGTVKQLEGMIKSE